MNKKIFHLASALAILLLVICISQVSTISNLKAQITALQTSADSCHNEQQKNADIQRGMKTLFSGQVDTKVEQP